MVFRRHLAETLHADPGNILTFIANKFVQLTEL